ncbi:MAG: AmmeMemoRadiSam system protein B [Bacteroidota bacterium]
MNIRRPAVAGRFYPDDKKELQNYLQELLRDCKKNPDLRVQNLIGGVVPHAGYMFSGIHAASFFYLLQELSPPDVVVILHPSHSGMGYDLCVDGHEGWKTPLGVAPVMHALAHKLELPLSTAEQLNEHSAEVMVPFLQHVFYPEIPILPVSYSHQPGNARHLGDKLAAITMSEDLDMLVIASSDFSHFLTPDEGFRADQVVVNAIMEKNAARVVEKIRKQRISVCGFGPIATLMYYAEGVSQGRYQPHMLSRGHSGEIIPSEEVVDYVSFGFFDSP